MSTTTAAFVPTVPCAVTASCSTFLGAQSRPKTQLIIAKRARTRPPRMQDMKEPSANDSGEEAESPNIENRDWREFRAALVVGSVEALEKTKETAYRTGHWAHSLSLPETGCFLASHPAYYRRNAPYLTQAVVFVTKYGPDSGATGLVLNRPLRGTAAELEADGVFGRSSNLSATTLGSQPVYLGGPDLIESGVVTLLHGNRHLDTTDTRQPLDGVYVGAVSNFLDGIESGLVKPSEGRLFSGCLRWGPGKLEREVDDGSWYCVSASPLFALKHCIQLPKPLWVEIMQSQGKPFAQIAKQVYDDDNEEYRSMG